MFERYCTVIEADVIKNFGFVHIDAEVQRNKVNEILRELNGYNLKGNQIRVQLSTSGGRGGDRDGGGGGRGPMGGGRMGGDRFGGGMGGRGGSMNRGGGGGYSAGGPMRGHNGAFGGQGGYSNGGGGGGGSFGRDPYPQQARPAYMRDPMGGGGGGGGYDGGAGGYGGQGFAGGRRVKLMTSKSVIISFTFSGPLATSWRLRATDRWRGPSPKYVWRRTWSF